MSSGYLDVGDGHELYYEDVGDSTAPAALFIHGGPGSGFTESHKKLLALEGARVIFYDQRGAGRSKPYLSLENNVTGALIEDIGKLLDHLNVERVVLAGASWGATLALLYALRHPERVRAMVLMSVFLATRDEAIQFVDGSAGVAYPLIWERFVNIVPEEHRHAVAEFYLEKMLVGTTEEQEKYAFNWALYDISLSIGEPSFEKLEKPIRTMSYRSLALLTAYYIVNNFFLPNNYILDNAEHLIGIPMTLIQGTDDVITPPKMATELHQQLPQSTLTLLKGLHAGEAMKQKFTDEITRLSHNDS